MNNTTLTIDDLVSAIAGKAIWYSPGYKYQLKRDYVHQLPKEFGALNIDTGYVKVKYGKMLIKYGYAWNGCSGPAIDTNTNMRAGLVHDALYQLMVEGHLSRNFKDAADNEFRRICKEDGMWPGRAAYFHAGVQMFGKSSTIKNTQIIVAP